MIKSIIMPDRNILFVCLSVYAVFYPALFLVEIWHKNELIDKIHTKRLLLATLCTRIETVALAKNSKNEKNINN